MYSLGVGTQLSLGSDESDLVRAIRELSNDGGWTGSIRTLTIDTKVRLVPPIHSWSSCLVPVAGDQGP